MMMNMKNQQQQCHLYAQKLNNRAALCIEIGHYDRAIASLAKALRLSAGNNHSNSDQHQRQHQHQEEEERQQQHQHRQPQPVCHCNYCSLDGCIAYSESISATEELTKQMAKKNIKIASSKSSSTSTSTSSSTDGSSTTKSSFLSQHNKSFLSQQKQQQQHKKNKEKDNDNNTHDLTSNNNNSLLSNDKIYGSCDSYIYRRPIRITSRTIQEGHNMGSTLFLIITFNLALAHHLSAVDSDVDAVDAVDAVDNNNSSSTDSTTTSCSCNENNRIKKTLQLYEISNKWHIQSSNCHLYNDGDDDSGRYNESTMMTQHEQHQQQQHQQLNRDEYDSSSAEEQQQQPDDDASTSTSKTSRNVSSIRFNMIICNNLSHIHCLVSNHSKHKQCLEHLLSQVMVALEYKTRTTSSPPSSNNDQHQDYGAAAAAAAAATEDYTLQMDLDGFLQSASSLILQEKCAKAA